MQIMTVHCAQTVCTSVRCRFDVAGSQNCWLRNGRTFVGRDLGRIGFGAMTVECGLCHVESPVHVCGSFAKSEYYIYSQFNDSEFRFILFLIRCLRRWSGNWTIMHHKDETIWFGRKTIRCMLPPHRFCFRIQYLIWFSNGLLYSNRVYVRLIYSEMEIQINLKFMRLSIKLILIGVRCGI